MFTIFEKKTEDEKGRDFYFDNAKFIIILLVVIAHIISPIKTHMPFVKAVWTLINAFHMPCLIMISGYFAKSYFLQDVGVKKQRLFTYFIIWRRRLPYLCLNILCWIIRLWQSVFLVPVLRYGIWSVCVSGMRYCHILSM